MIIILQSAIKNGNIFIVPDTVTTLADDQLQQFTNITTLEIPASVNDINPRFISYNITQVKIDNENKNYETYENGIYTKDGKKLIRYYGNDNSVKIKDGVEIISAYSFEGKNLSEVELPKSLKAIGSQVFSRCKNSKNISLGENVEEINELFIYNSGIENLTINSENQNYSIRNGALYNKDGTIFILPVKPLGSIETYEIPEGVEKIAQYAFHYQYNLKEIKLPSTLKTIGLSFNYCRNLTKIEIPSSVTSINANCFSYCQNLREVIINNEKGIIQGSPWGNPFGDRAIFWNG